MKPLRITVVLLTLLVMPLFGSETSADFTADTVNIGRYETRVNAYTDNQPVIGFTIPADGETLKTVQVRSFMERAYATEKVELWAESGGGPGFQSSYDILLKTIITFSIPFQTNDIVTFASINHVISGVDTFYLTLDIYTDSVNAWPEYFHQTGLEVVLDSGFIILNAGAGGVNLNHVRNKGWIGPPGPYFDPFRLIFDTQGPQFDLHFCVEDSTCSLLIVDQEDSVRICATNISPDIAGNIYIIDAKKMFGQYPISLEPDVCDPAWMVCGCDSCFNTAFRIPDLRNIGGYDGIDADTGQWMICAWADDSVGNRDTMCIGHDDLPWKIDTRKPLIDSVQFYLSYDANSDGIIALGDSVYVIGWGLSNPFFEVVKMEADMSIFGLGWVELDDALNNNRVFRKEICLDEPVAVDTVGYDLFTIVVRAWDNACNYDTLRKGIANWVDLDPPSLSALYEYHRDLDTTLACIGEGDSVRIGAWVAGPDIVSVEFNIKDAGIDSAGYLYYPLFDDSTHGDPTPNDGEYNLLWEVTAPPIEDGKDADNCIPPDVDTDYSVLIWAFDDAENFDTARTGQLNRTLDTRLPRPIGFNCPDSLPSALHGQTLPAGNVMLSWDRDCDECDAWFFYVYVDSGFGYETTPIGATYDGEPGGDFNIWISEPLFWERYYRFKIRTNDNCGNLGPYSHEVDFPFAPAVNYEAGDGPYSVFCADLDGDTDLDLAVANEYSDTVSILKNTGDGTYETKVDYAAGSGPSSVFCADLDGEGDLDLAVANAISNMVSILKNNGDGSFQTAVTYGAGSLPQSVFCADLDGDTDLDLAVANFWDHTVSILKNNGDGTFQTKVDYGAGDAISVFCADLDGDTDLDLAVANHISNTVSILKNNGDGTFQTKIDYGAGDYPHYLFCADLDGDGDLDLAVANYHSDNVSILKNNGDGTFQTKVDYVAGDDPNSVFCADLDGDTDLDLAVANGVSENVSILKNNGDGTFQTKVDYGAGDYPHSVFCADLDGDTDLDLAVGNRGGDNVSILKNLTQVSANQPPWAFSLISPVDEDTTFGTTTFQWHIPYDPNFGDQMRYDLYVSTSPGFEPEYTDIDSNLPVSKFITAMESGTYYWKVKTTDNWGAETWSTETWSFAVRPLFDTLWIVAYSPVDLIVTDPVGDSISPWFNTIQDADYDTTVDWNEDGDNDDLVTIPHPYVGEYQIRVIREDDIAPDDTTYDLGIRINGSDMTMVADDEPLPPPDGSSDYSYDCLPCLRGDVNCDGVINSADIVFLINYLFKSGPAPDPLELGDVNCDDVINSADVVHLIDYLFKGGPPPCS